MYTIGVLSPVVFPSKSQQYKRMKQISFGFKKLQLWECWNWWNELKRVDQILREDFEKILGKESENTKNKNKNKNLICLINYDKKHRKKSGKFTKTFRPVIFVDTNWFYGLSPENLWKQSISGKINGKKILEYLQIFLLESWFFDLKKAWL